MKVQSRIARFLFLCLLLLIASAPAHAVKYVSTDGSDSDPGTQTEPYLTLQHAYAQASEGETVFVSPGTYDECVNTEGLLKWVEFIAIDDDPTQTVIDGNNCTTITIGGEGGRIEGFTVTGGTESGIRVNGSAAIVDNIITGNFFSGVSGGGILVDATLTCIVGEIRVDIVGNDIDNNWAPQDGGGVWVDAGHDDSYCQSNNITINISNNMIRNSVAFDTGGGLFLEADSLVGRRIDLILADNDILNNQAPDFDSIGGGGRLRLVGEGIETLEVSGNTIDGNDVEVDGAGLYVRMDIDPTGDKSILIDNNTVTNNSADDDGGGLYVRLKMDDVDVGQSASVVVSNNTISGNAAAGDLYGGGGLLARWDMRESLIAEAALAEFKVIGNVISGNSSELVGGGLGLSVDANINSSGICISTPNPADAVIEVENNLIFENAAFDSSLLDAALGGGVSSLTRACAAGSATAVFRLNTIVENTTEDGAGGIELGMESVFGGLSRAVISNSLITHNEGDGIGGLTQGTNIDVDVDHSNLFNNGTNYESWIGNRTGTEGNTAVGPGYVSRASDNYHLNPSSNMIDAGARVPGPIPETDLDGDPRAVDGDEDGLTVVDIGFDEYFVCTDDDRDGFGSPVVGGDLCTEDNCPDDYNPGQSDCDGDMDGDACDPDTVDGDSDQVEQACDLNDSDPFTCGDADEDTCDDCVLGLSDPLRDGLDSDNDGLCDAGDPDDDGDGVDDGADSDDFDPFVCSDIDADTCDDCSSGFYDPANDGTDGDGDGVCSDGDSNDGNSNACADRDGDNCDDCLSGSYDPANDGTDSDADGVCDEGDPDDDNDGVDDGDDSDPFDPNVCRDFDGDTCEDCTSGTSNPADDGTDTDGDGLCDAGDDDDDDDGVDDGDDSDPLDPNVCRDFDGDTCDDCTSGTSNPADDGTDTDGDGLCDAGDDDDDDDGVDDGDDSDPLDPNVCRDFDGDTCDDCTSGTSNPADDGTDTDGDGLCDAGDDDDDDDGVDDGDDSDPLDPNVCRDFDGDTCDDCTSGASNPADDGTDTDADGLCDAGDDDDDNDGVLDGGDPATLDPDLCGDSDSDTCDDCAVGQDDFGPLADNDPANDGSDVDGDGLCDAGDDDDDNDGVDDGGDSDPLDPDVCVDSDSDTCDDCAVGQDDFGPLADNDPANDGSDVDGDGVCDAGDDDSDNDGVDDLNDSDPLDPAVCSDVDADTCEDCSGGPSDLLNVAFTADEDGFAYADDTFRGTTEPVYADGSYQAAGGFDGGGLSVILGGVNDDDILGMSGGWQRSFNLVAPATVALSFRYNLSISSEFEPTEVTQVLVALDGVLYGQGANDWVDELAGDGTAQSTGWQQFQVDLGELPAGPHSVVIGGHLSGKTTAGESSDLLFDDVTLSIPTIYNPANDGPDGDADGICNDGDPDDDGDGVDDGDDSDPLDPSLCRDADNDTCDDCVGGSDDPANDGPDQDTDGLCDAGDPDDDDDGVDDGDDSDPLNPNLCRDDDGDTCDDCTSGAIDPADDGTDTDSDGLCDAGDTDDDNDGVLDGGDPATLDPDLCGDSDSDTCDDCAVGTDNLGPAADNLPGNDGPDFDGDGACNAGDDDDDDDGVDDGDDSDPLNPNLCRDDDGDTCDDCTSGASDPADDGTDTDSDGLCDAGDTDDDNDGVLDGGDPATLDPDLCGDSDSDTCDDCAVGTDNLGPAADNLPGNDGPDFDGDGACNAGDDDDDDDGVDDGDDSDPLNPNLCRDADGDTCEDCTSGASDPADDGTDTDSDGLCDAGDTDDDNDGVLDGGDPATLDPDLCGDSDSDTCDDCAVGTDNLGPAADNLPGNDGPDFDGDGACNAGDDDDDDDGVDDGDDSDPLNPNLCRDADGDTCDDCTSGASNQADDGTDTDSDGLCDAGDTDDDNDGVLDGGDPATLDPDLCGDSDSDTCDDCAVGTDNLGPAADNLPGNDGPDFDGDGACNAGDPDDDNDGTADGADCAPFVNSVAQPAPAVGATVRFAADKTTFDWIPVTDSNVYNVYRGSVAPGSPFAYNHSCLATEMTKTDAEDASVPAGGELLYYLVSATNRCGGDGSLGTDSAAAERPNPSACSPLGIDSDSDGVDDIDDNCPVAMNSDQTDADLDGFGNSCDNCAAVSNILQIDFDGDGQGDECDLCTDADGDTYGDPGFPLNSCPEDNCPTLADADLTDSDGDGIGNPCDRCPGDTINDPDGDGLCATEDNCPLISNANQFDQDGDLIGDVCDSCTDFDNDGRGRAIDPCGYDNCPTTANSGQEDSDGDLVGDACDTCTDIDGDGFGNPGFPASVCVLDNCPDVSNSQSDLDSDGLGNECDACSTNPNLGCVACPPGEDPDGDGTCQTEIVVAEQGTALTWLANQSDPGFGLDWTTDTFSPDGSWQPGSYGIGYDNGNEADLLIDTDVPPGSRSVYTRISFNVADAGQVQRVQIGADYDDGYAAWINGDEIFRSPEMPSGEPAWNTSSSQSEASNLPEPNYLPFNDVTTAGTGAIQTGANVLAVGAWNHSPASSDLVLVPRVSYFTSLDNCPDVANWDQQDTDTDGVGDACDPCFDNPDPVCGGCPLGTDPDGDGICIIEEVLLEQSTSMLWLANQSDPGFGLDWTTDTFTPDGTWQTGAYGLGYDTSFPNALIDTDVPVSSWSVYTRVVYNLPDASEVKRVLIGADYDDGYMAWVNGDEIFRSPEMPAGDPAWNTPSALGESSNLPNPDYDPLSDVTAPASGALVTGDNVIAIGVWNTGPTSSDLILVPRISYFTSLDNCPNAGNPGQEDTDGDGIGDVCDPD